MPSEASRLIKATGPAAEDGRGGEGAGAARRSAAAAAAAATTTTTTPASLSSPRRRALAVQYSSVLVLVLCSGWVWRDAAFLRVSTAAAGGDAQRAQREKDALRQISASATLGWMFLFEALGQVGLIVASRRHVAAEDDVGRGDLADGLPSTSKDLAAGGDIRVDFHVWMRSEDAVKRWSSFISYLSFIVLVSFCRFQLAGQALDADLSGSKHSTALQIAALCLFGPQLVGAGCYALYRRWPAKWYGAIVFLLCPFFAGGAMLSRFGDGVDRDGDQAFWGAVVLVMYMGPFMVYTLGEPHVQRWHLEVMSLFVWVMLALLGRSMML
jgi:hypothetical protein